jgi:hypothetical protein
LSPELYAVSGILDVPNSIFPIATDIFHGVNALTSLGANARKAVFNAAKSAIADHNGNFTSKRIWSF